jgi:lipoprotein-anchoring transpeptidase ErfK/SrfK
MRCTGSDDDRAGRHRDDGTGRHDDGRDDNDDHDREEADSHQEAGAEGREGCQYHEDPCAAGPHARRVHRITPIVHMRALHQRGRAALPLALGFVLSVSLVAAPHSRAELATVTPAQQLVRVLSPHVARSAPNEHATAVEVVRAQRPLTGERTTLPVVGRATGPAGTAWLHVALPGRPNGHTGWIKKQATLSLITRWHVVVDTSARRVTVYQNGRAIRVFSAVVGKPSTPTPHGTFFVEEDVKLRPGDAGAPYAIALSARSDVFQEFEGGPGQIALHGLANVGGVLGTAASHGCVRLDASAMRWLVGRIGPGMPVTITP